MALHCWSGPLAGFAVKHLSRAVVHNPRACICLVIVITELVSLVPSISADIGGRCLISMGTKNGLRWTDAHTNAMENIHTTYTCRRTDKCTSYKGGLVGAGWGAPAALRLPVIRYSRECYRQTEAANETLRQTGELKYFARLNQEKVRRISSSTQFAFFVFVAVCCCFSHPVSSFAVWFSRI